jgi:hypothetical protein
LAAWVAKLKGVPVLTFQSPELFLKAHSLDPELTAGNVLIISDYHFDKMSEMNGVDLALRIDPLPVILCSNFDFDLDVLSRIKNIIGIIPKQPLALEELILKTKKS